MLQGSVKGSFNTNIDLLKKYGEIARERLNITNCQRVNVISIVLTVCTLGLLLLDYYYKQKGLWIATPGFELLFYNHIVQGVGSLFFSLIYFLFKRKLMTQPHLSVLFFYGFIAFALNVCAFMSGLTDQYIHGQISVYVIACFIIAVFFYQRPKYSVLMYLQSYVAFLVYLTISQKNFILLEGNYVNATVAVIFAIFLSILLSNMMERDFLYRYSLEDIVKERTMELEKSLEKVQKYERINLIDKMAATVAHEVRNPLTTIKGFLQLLKNKQHDRENVEYFNIMISEIDRANSMIAEFLSMSRSKATAMRWGNITKVITSLLPLIDADATFKNMRLSTDFSDVPEILLDEQEINQLVLNLARNGIEAMTEGGCLTLKIYQDDDEVILLVADEGPGIKQEILNKLGTPFFTTKETGTGLGLVVCNSIAERHNAKLQIKSGVKGSTFEVHFKIPSKA